MTIYTEPKTLSEAEIARRAAASEACRIRNMTKNPSFKGQKKKGYTVTEAVRTAARDRWMKLTPEERSANAKKAGTTLPPEVRSANASKRNKARIRHPWKQESRDRLAKYQNDRIEAGEFKVQMSYKGRFRPNNPSKYMGDSTNIVYRSGLELRFCQHLDSSAGVIKWSSEETIVPYFDQATQKWRRYFPDFLVVVKQGSGTLTQLIEIKPAKECVPPKGTLHQDGRKNRRLLKEQLTYVTNQCKWTAAESYALDRGWKFKIITDKDILGLK